MSRLFIPLAILTLIYFPLPTPAQPLRVSETPATITLDNPFVGLTWDKHRALALSLRASVAGKQLEIGQGDRTLYLDYNGHSAGKDNYVHPFAAATCRLQHDSPDSAQIILTAQPQPTFPFQGEMHILLRAADHGFYVYVIYRHGPGMAAVDFAQSRVVVRGASTSKYFTHYFVAGGAAGPYPTGRVLKAVQDTTWLYADGQIHSKYDWCSFIGQDNVFGMAGPRVGLWIIQPSREYVNGGPLRQELTVHQSPDLNGGPQENIMQWMFQGTHFGGPPIHLDAGQPWTRFYGPALIFINAGRPAEQLWPDAQSQAASEESNWPYSFIHDPDYPLARGSVHGRIHLTDDESLRNAWVVLAAPGDNDWRQSSIGYQFWTHDGADGAFTIPKVRPGAYALFVSGANQFEDLRIPDVHVTADQTTDLGVLDWKPLTQGQTLWQIGLPDCSSSEFHGGADVRHYDNFIRYIHDFPNDVTFTIGKSREERDWNFAQFGWYAKKPYWSILFDEPQSLHGLATLTLAFAAWDYPRPMTVALNGKRIGSITFKKSGPAIYRSGGQDSLRQIVYLPFDASLIHAGQNEFRLSLTGAIPYADPENHTAVEIGGVAYDAIRLETDPTATFPAPP